MRTALSCAVCLLCLLGCEASFPKRPPGAMPIIVDDLGDEHAMQRVVEQHIAVGMPLQKACSTLKQHGFTYHTPKSDEPVILCYAAEPAGKGTRHARVWLYFDLKGTVTKIEAHSDRSEDSKS